VTPAQVRRKSKTIKKNLDKWNIAYKDLQAICPHIDHYQKKEGTGSRWCKDDEAYWVEHYCSDCDKRWITDQK